MNIDYHPLIEKELQEIKRYYEEQSPGLGAEFVDEFEKQVWTLAGAPERWMVIEKDIRRCLMRRFPFIVYFRKVDQSSIRILVVKHQKRHPNYGRERE